LLTLETGLVVQLIEIGKIGDPVNGRWAWGQVLLALKRATILCVVKNTGSTITTNVQMDEL
jgi:hypothetical protein